MLVGGCAKIQRYLKASTSADETAHNTWAQTDPASAVFRIGFIASRQQGGRQGNRKLLNRVKSVLDTLCRVKKCILLKLEKLTVNFSFTKINC